MGVEGGVLTRVWAEVSHFKKHSLLGKRALKKQKQDNCYKTSIFKLCARRSAEKKINIV